MKKCFLLLLSCILLLTSVLFVEVDADETETTVKESELYARSAVLMDADSGRILYAKNGDSQLPMASTTKIMTCIVALERGNLEDMITVSNYAARMPKVHLGMQEGEHYKLADILYSLMLESHNDSAVAVAEHIAGSVESFADYMNQKAAEIGCKNTYFITPNGLDAEKEVTAADGSTEKKIHSTTAQDLAKILSYCITKSSKKEEFLKITQTPQYSFTSKAVAEDGTVAEGGRNFSCTNHNAFLGMMEGAVSGKTGFTGNAGYCYTGALKRDDRTFVVALLACGWPNNKSYKWSDTRKLMEYGIASYQKFSLGSQEIKQEWLDSIPIYDAQTDKLWQQAYVPLTVAKEENPPEILMRNGEKAEISCSIKKCLTAPVKADTKIGKITYKVDGNIYWERSVRTAQSFDKIDFTWCFKQIFYQFCI